MAFRQLLRNKEIIKDVFRGALYFWNVSGSVGYGCTNNSSDVRLVQFLLNTDMRDSKRGKLLVEDGKFGGKTWNAIKKYQADDFYYNDKHGDVEQSYDGMVSKTDGSRLISTKSKTIYTILMLNYRYQRATQYFFDITKDPKLPRELRNGNILRSKF